MPGQMGCESAVGIECRESGAPKGAERFQIGPEAAGLGKAAPGLEPEASVEVTSAKSFYALSKCHSSLTSFDDFGALPGAGSGNGRGEVVWHNT